MLLSVLLIAFIGAVGLAVAVLLMGGTFWQAIVVYSVSGSAVVLALAMLKARRGAGKPKDRD